MYARTKAILMYKAPVEGQSKTRLGESIGHRKAIELYRWLGARQLFSVPKAWSTEVRYAPDEAERIVCEWLGPGISLVPQGDGDLGERMYRAVCDGAEELGVGKLIVLGADCPAIDQSLLLEAESRLESADIVMGPSKDGGYYLIGMKLAYETLFRGVAWGGDSVFEVTMDRIRTLGLSVELLEMREDIDDLESLCSQRSFIDREVWARLW